MKLFISMQHYMLTEILAFQYLHKTGLWPSKQGLNWRVCMDYSDVAMLRNFTWFVVFSFLLILGGAVLPRSIIFHYKEAWQGFSQSQQAALPYSKVCFICLGKWCRDGIGLLAAGVVQPLWQAGQVLPLLPRVTQTGSGRAAYIARCGNI